jgi:hypothetical protein
MFLSISYNDLPVNFGEVHNIHIDYLDSTLNGVISDGIFAGSEITLLKFKDYGIVLDNRIGKGYEIYDGDETHLTILFNKK